MSLANEDYMATLETFQKYKDACDDLSVLCSRVREKDREVFEKMAETFQGWTMLFEPDYWKISEVGLQRNLQEVRCLTELVQKTIDQ